MKIEDRAIQIFLPLFSRAKALKVFTIKKFIFGEKFRYNLILKNRGNVDFPDSDCEIIIKLIWRSDQYSEIGPFKLDKGSISPNQERIINIGKADCMIDGFCLVYARFEFAGKQLLFQLLNENDKLIPLTCGTTSIEEGGLFVNHCNSDGGIKTFYVDNWNNYYAFWLLVMSILTTMVAVTALLISLNG